MTTIYVVTSGSYSDYTIHALFSTKELAEGYMNTYGNSDFNDVELYELDPKDEVDLIKQGYKRYKVIMWKNGDVEAVELSSLYYTTPPFGKTLHRFYWETMENGGVMDVSCFAKDSDHAVKIAGEIRTQVLATNQWGIDKFRL